MQIGQPIQLWPSLRSRGYIYIYFNDPSREPYQTVSTVYSLKKDGKERGAKNGEITYDELDFWAD